ncbi:MAG: UbiA family prenyltransferase [Candidatus Bilamarchaeaceae archaeon]
MAERKGIPPLEQTPLGLLLKLKEYYALVRFEHAVMLAIAVLIGVTVSFRGALPLDQTLLLALIVPIFSEMGSFALNDYLDLETDKINGKTERPLVRGAFPPWHALAIAAFSFAVSFAASYLLNAVCFIIAVAYNLFAILYDIKLKDLPLLGNVFIATTMAIPFLFGSYAYGIQPSLTIWIIAALGFIAGLAREIVKSVEDVEGDSKARKAMTLPIAIGKGPSLFLAAILFVLFIPLSIMPYMVELRLSFVSGIFLGIADATILMVALYLLYIRNEKRFAVIRKYSLAGLFCGLLSLLLASLGF